MEKSLQIGISYWGEFAQEKDEGREKESHGAWRD